LAPDGNGGFTVRTTGDQGSGILSSMALANCFIVLPADTVELRGGRPRRRAVAGGVDLK
jgi:molybdopterin molybdotransferase